MGNNSHLLSKSQQNIESANLLIGNKYLAASIHCSYYSCIQVMLHILRSDLNKTEDEITNERKKGSEEEHGFHNWIQNFIFKEVVKREHDGRITLDFYSTLGKLKGMRVRSDYETGTIGEKEASKALEEAKKINSIITERFKI